MLEEIAENSLTHGLPLILALDTSSKLTSIAIARGAKIIANFEAELEDNRSSRLWELIDFLLKAVGFTAAEVDLFAVCIGPGGFTGLRVGIAATKGLAAAANKLTVGVTSLEATAAAAYTAENVCVLSNAYKGEVYWQLFAFDEAGMPVAQSLAAVSPLSQALEGVGHSREIFFVGDAAESNKNVILEFVNIAGESEEMCQPVQAVWPFKEASGFLAKQIARLAYYKFLNGQALQPEELSAFYVRSADAKIKKQV